ncbi:hypothetical protein ACFL0U_04360 [Pseudomonadota bacterium]
MEFDEYIEQEAEISPKKAIDIYSFKPSKVAFASIHETVRARSYEEEITLGTSGLEVCIAIVVIGKNGNRSLTHLPMKAISQAHDDYSFGENINIRELLLREIEFTGDVAQIIVCKGSDEYNYILASRVFKVIRDIEKQGGLFLGLSKKMLITTSSAGTFILNGGNLEEEYTELHFSDENEGRTNAYKTRGDINFNSYILYEAMFGKRKLPKVIFDAALSDDGSEDWVRDTRAEALEKELLFRRLDDILSNKGCLCSKLASRLIGDSSVVKLHEALDHHVHTTLQKRALMLQLSLGEKPRISCAKTPLPEHVEVECILM